MRKHENSFVHYVLTVALMNLPLSPVYCLQVTPIPVNTPIQDDKLRCVCISDTHTKIEIHPEMVPPGDVLIHGGDITNVGFAKEVFTFDNFLGTVIKSSR